METVREMQPRAPPAAESRAGSHVQETYFAGHGLVWSKSERLTSLPVIEKSP